MTKLMIICLLGLATNAHAADPAPFIKSVLAAPEKTGATCMKSSTGRMCYWEKTKWFGSAEAVIRTPAFYTVIFTNPTFKLNDFGVKATPGPEYWKVNQGALKTNFVQEPAVNGDRQINLQSALAHAKLK